MGSEGSEDNQMKNEHSSSRREFVKKAAYVAPAILTLQAAPAYVKAGSIKEQRQERVERIRERVEQVRERIQDRI
jgi:hypothetical protein